MDPRVVQLEDASLQCCHESLHIQQDRVERNPSLCQERGIFRTFSLIFCTTFYVVLLPHLPSFQVSLFNEKIRRVLLIP